MAKGQRHVKGRHAKRNGGTRGSRPEAGYFHTSSSVKKVEHMESLRGEHEMHALSHAAAERAGAVEVAAAERRCIATHGPSSAEPAKAALAA